MCCLFNIYIDLNKGRTCKLLLYLYNFLWTFEAEYHITKPNSRHNIPKDVPERLSDLYDGIMCCHARLRTSDALSLFPRTRFIFAWIKEGVSKDQVLGIINQNQTSGWCSNWVQYTQEAIRSLVALSMLWCWPDKEKSTKVCIAYSLLIRWCTCGATL